MCSADGHIFYLAAISYKSTQKQTTEYIENHMQGFMDYIYSCMDLKRTNRHSGSKVSGEFISNVR